MRARFGIGDGRDDDEAAVGGGLDHARPTGEVGQVGKEGADRVHGRLDDAQQPVGARRAADGPFVVAREVHRELAGGGIGGDLDETEPRLVRPRRTVSPPDDLDRGGVPEVGDREHVVASRARSSAASGPAWSSTTTSPSDSANPTASTPRHASQLQLEVVEAHEVTVTARARRSRRPGAPGRSPRASAAPGPRPRPAGRGTGRGRLAQAPFVEAERAPSRAQHLAAESGYVDDHRGVSQLVLRDEVIEGQIDGGDARTPTRRVDQ